MVQCSRHVIPPETDALSPELRGRGSVCAGQTLLLGPLALVPSGSVPFVCPFLSVSNGFLNRCSWLRRVRRDVHAVTVSRMWCASPGCASDSARPRFGVWVARLCRMRRVAVVDRFAFDASCDPMQVLH